MSSHTGTPILSAAKGDRLGHRSRCEHALFVEDAVIRKVVLETRRDDAAIDQDSRVEDLAVVSPGRRRDQRRALCALANQAVDRGVARVDDRRAKHEIFRGISDDGKFGKHDEIRSQRRRFSASLSNASEVAGDVADGGIELRERNRQLHGSTLYYGFSPAKAGPLPRVVASGFSRATETRMQIGVPSEQHPGERRVALVPASIAPLKKAGFDVTIERGAGQSAGFPDAAYAEKGAQIAAARNEVFSSDVILQVRVGDMALMRPGQVVIGMADPLGDPETSARSFVAPRRRVRARADTTDHARAKHGRVVLHGNDRGV